MITFRTSADVPDDRHVVLTVPPEVPIGNHDFVVTVATRSDETPKRPRSSLADWAEGNAEAWGNRLSSEDVEGFTGRSL